MNKLLKIAAVGGLVAMSIGLAGCQNTGTNQNSGKAPDVALQEGIDKLSSVTSYTFDSTINGDLKGPVDPATGTVEAPESVKFNLKMDGGADLKDVKDPRFNLNLSGDMMADQDGGNADFSFRMNKEAVYLNLSKLEGKGTVQIPQELVDQYVGKWWTFALPAGALDELSKSLPQGNEQQMTPEQKQMKELFQNTKFFKDVKYVNDEMVAGENSAHYAGILDKTAFVAFAQKAAELQGQTMSETEKADLAKAMEMIEFNGEMYVGNTSGVLNKVKGTMVLKQNTDKVPTGTVNFDFSLANINKPVNVEVPADAQPFPTELLGLM